MLTWATNRLMNVLDQVGREWENRRLRAELQHLKVRVADLEAEVAEVSAERERLEEALTQAHGTIFDLGPDPIGEESAIDTAAELAAFRKQLEAM
jgi:predicted  nucleic acid-binding Zn-ribbon protein